VKKIKRIAKQRERRAFRVRNKLKRNSTRLKPYDKRPRMCIFRSNKHIYVQIIDDEAGRTLVAASSTEPQLRQEMPHGGNVAAAAAIGKAIASRAQEAGIKQVAFDRREYRYLGRVAALATAAREAGLEL
jgi:large subunit ribosomal protein L18